MKYTRSKILFLLAFWSGLLPENTKVQNIKKVISKVVIHRNSGFDSGSGRNLAISVPAGIEGIPVTDRNPKNITFSPF